MFRRNVCFQGATTWSFVQQNLVLRLDNFLCIESYLHKLSMNRASIDRESLDHVS